MLSQHEIEIFSTVSFEVYPQQILGDGFNNVKILAIIDADTAKNWIDPAARHAEVYPTLPAGSIDRFDQYLYLKIGLNNGDTTVLGLPWIKKSSYVVQTNKTMRIILDGINLSDEPRVRAALNSNGFNTFKIDYI